MYEKTGYKLNADGTALLAEVKGGKDTVLQDGDLTPAETQLKALLQDIHDGRLVAPAEETTADDVPADPDGGEGTDADPDGGEGTDADPDGDADKDADPDGKEE